MEDDNNEIQKGGAYAYLNRDSFTSEVFKIEIKNLKRFMGVSQVKKRLTSLGLRPHKVKILREVTFVTFCNAEDRDAAVVKLNGHTWKGCELVARLARPRVDPCLVKRHAEGVEDDSPVDKMPRTGDHSSASVDTISSLREAVTPFWNLEYIQQLKRKTRRVKSCLESFHDRLRGANRQVAKLDGSDQITVPCPLSEILPAPESAQENYRNKCELTIGRDVTGELDNLVGFRLGRYRGGVTAVAEPYELGVMPHIMSVAVRAMQSFLDASKEGRGGLTHYSSFDNLTHKGHWKGLTVRTSCLNHVLLIVEFHSEGLNEQELTDVKRTLAEWFAPGGEGAAAGVTSLLMMMHTSQKSSQTVEPKLDLLSGEPWLVEQLLQLQFRVSPLAFFQVNTLAAEVLVHTVSELAQLDPTNSVLLDVCCGTGTLGLSLAARVLKVLGVELCSAAVEDARENAHRNGITNAEFHSGRAEVVLPRLLTRLPPRSIPVAVLDPPRAGLHTSVIHLLRRCPGLDRLVYVACDPSAAAANWLDLGREESKRFKGQPFLPVRAQPVDLFPKTAHVELVMLLERVPKRQKHNHDSVINPEYLKGAAATSGSGLNQESCATDFSTSQSGLNQESASESVSLSVNSRTSESAAPDETYT